MCMGPPGALRRRSLLSACSRGGRPVPCRWRRRGCPPDTQAVGHRQIRDVARPREYRKGRVLQIGTTDLDAGRAVTWNMGAINSSDAPGALELPRKIMVWHSDVLKVRMSDDSSHCPQDAA